MMKVKRNYKTVLKLFLVCCIVTAAFSNFAVFAEDAADAYTFGVYHVYNSDGTEALTPAEIKAGQLKISYEFVKIAAKDKDRSVKLYAAVYGTNDELLYADSEYVSVIEKFCAFDLDGITVSEGDLAKIKSLKVFVWEKDGMKPVIEPYALGTAYVDTMKEKDPTGRRYYVDDKLVYSNQYPPYSTGATVAKYTDTFIQKDPAKEGWMYYNCDKNKYGKTKYVEIVFVGNDSDPNVVNYFDRFHIRYKLNGEYKNLEKKDYKIESSLTPEANFYESKTRIICELPDDISEINISLQNWDSWIWWASRAGYARIARVTIY